MRVASRRARFINVSITLCTIAALLIALVVALLFSSIFVPISLAVYVAALFVLAMFALVGALVSFLVEVRIAIAALRIGASDGTRRKKRPRVWGPGSSSGLWSKGREKSARGSVQVAQCNRDHCSTFTSRAAMPMLRAMMRERLAEFPARLRLAVELDDAAVLLQATRVRLLHQEVRVVLDAHGAERY